MTGDFVVVLLLIVNGRLRQAMFVLLRLIGVVVGFANLPTGSKRCIRGVGKVRMLFGVQLSESHHYQHKQHYQTVLPNSGSNLVFATRTENCM